MLKRVLIVDDEPELVAVLSMALELNGFAVESALCGAEAIIQLRAAAAGSRPFDALLLDIVMPDVNGWQVLETIRADEVLADLPVIVVTGRATEADHIERIKMYDCTFVNKRERYVDDVLAELERIWPADIEAGMG